MYITILDYVDGKIIIENIRRKNVDKYLSDRCYRDSDIEYMLTSKYPVILGE